MNRDFALIAQRAAALRLTERELVALVDPPMSYPTYWRAKTDVTAGLGTKVKVLRRVEATLDRLTGTNPGTVDVVLEADAEARATATQVIEERT